MLTDHLTLLAVKITAVLAAVAICVSFWMLMAELLHRVLG